MEQKSQAMIGRANTLLGLHFLSGFGDQITVALLALCLLDITKSTNQVGFVYFITTAGLLIFSFFGGIIGDSISRRKVLCSADCARGLVVLLLIVAIKAKSIGLIYAISFLQSVLGSLHEPAKASNWAETIPDRRLQRYNSLAELSNQTSTILGPVFAGLVIGWQFKELGFIIDAMTFFVCAIAFSKIVSQKTETKLVKNEFLKGFKAIWQQAETKKYVAYDAIQMIGFGAFNATFFILAQRDYGWSSTEYSNHLLIVAFFTTVGAIAGATNYVGEINPVSKLISCAVMSASALFSVLMIKSFPISSIFLGICDGLAVLTMAATKTKVQLIAKEFYSDHLASVLASRSIIIRAATLLGTGACLLLTNFISLEMALTLFVIPIGLSALSFIVGKDKELSVSSIPITEKIAE